MAAPVTAPIITITETRERDGATVAVPFRRPKVAVQPVRPEGAADA
jgi:hypothetical protein